MVNIINIEQDEKNAGCLGSGQKNDAKFLMMVTDHGTVRKPKFRV